MEPGEYTGHLPASTLVEEMLIAGVNPVLVMYTIQSHQIGYSGNHQFSIRCQWNCDKTLTSAG